MKKAMLICFLLLGGILSARAQDLASLGLEFKSKSREGNFTTYRFTLPEDIDISASVRSEELSLIDQERIQALVSIYRSFQFLMPSSIRILLGEERTEILLVPRSFIYKGQDLSRYMPSGIQFFYSDYLEFDFRIVVDNLFLRIKGQFFSEEEFAEKVTAAVSNPYAYLESQDPEFILKRFHEVEKRLDTLASQTLQGETALRAGLEETKALLEELNREFQLLRYALLVLNNRGFFGSIRLPSEEGIAKLIALKEQEPSLNIKEAGERLKSLGIEMTNKEIFLVFSVYFNEFN
ncbi:MAG TPA: hypothetical protein PLG79_05745 [Spirochaetales bacterium]|nr:hypothetical protein [Spirochaetales bacterium]HOV38207.1 hypothetical protein [Spirochaetales bacterium]